MKQITEEQFLKENLLKLVKEHKDNCHSSECSISLFHIRKLAEKAGITFTDDEKRSFM
jgi:hypothetical protein